MPEPDLRLVESPASATPPPSTPSQGVRKRSGSARTKSKKKTKSKFIEASREKPQRTLPTARISFAKQLDLLRGYASASGAANKPVTADEAASIVGLQRDTLSLMNPFFVDIGLLARDDQKNEARKYLPCGEVINFARAYQWNRETAAHKLAPVISGSWFGGAILQRLDFANLSEDEAIAILAEKASAPPDYKPQLRMLLSYLTATGLVQNENGLVSKANNSKTPSLSTDSSPVFQEGIPTKQNPSVSSSFLQPTQGIVNFHVDVKIDMSELAGWSPDRITAFFGGIAQVLAAKGSLEQGVAKN